MQDLISRRGLLFSALPLLARGDEKDSTFSTDVKVVNVLATVRDKQGKIVRNLAKDDFALSEDGRAQTIRYFSQETDLPLTLGLLIDTSGSQRRVLGAERSASYTFLSQVLREDKDQAFVIHFDREIELLQDLTPSRKKLQAALTTIESPGGGWGQRGGYPRGQGGGGRGRGGTALYDAVLLASDELMKQQTGRKAVIVLSDGVDNGSKVTLTDGIAAALRADTLAYSILFSDAQAYGGGRPQMGRRGGRGRMPAASHIDGKKVLQRLSRETGASFFEVSSKQPIERTFARIEEELRNQYSLGYTSDKPQADGGFRRIMLTAKQKGLVVQTRAGYYPAR